MRSGLASIHADEDVGAAMLAREKFAESKTRSIERGVVERRDAGNTANSVGTKEFLGHEEAGKV
jgi:hypothetical protein